MTIEVFSRSNSHELFEMMRSFIPPYIPCHEVTDFHGFEQSADYIYHIIDRAEEMCVNVDIDCFIFNFHQVISLAHQMHGFELTHYGVRDGGVIPHRNNSWAVMNPFLNIFNAPLIRELKEGRSWADIAGSGPQERWRTPPGIGSNHKHNRDEPFSGLFYWLYEEGTPIFEKNVKTHADGLTTTGPFFYHTWYSRDFFSDPIQRERIMERYYEAQKQKL